MKSRAKTPLVVLSVGFVLLSVCVAQAGVVTNTVFRIEATNATGTGYLDFTSGLVYNSGTNEWQWTLPGGATDITTGTGDVIATLNSANVQYVTDPLPNKWYAIGLGFDLEAGTTDTHVRIVSGLLQFDGPLPPSALQSPTGGARSTASFGATDRNGDGVTLQGWGPLGIGAYTSQYNGYVPGGTTFANLVNLVQWGPGGSGSVTGKLPASGVWQSLDVAVSDMSLLLDFSLSAGDSGSGTETYRILPEPAASLAFIVGCIVAFSRRRSC